MKSIRLIGVVPFVGALFLAACDYQRGYDAGREAGAAEVRAQIKNAYDEAYHAGYTAGFEAARPGTGRRPTGVWLYLTLGAAILGMAKIVVSLVVFTLLLILRSQNPYETAAKAIVTSLSALVLFWLSNSLTIGFSTTLDAIFLSAGAGNTLGKIVWGLIGAGGMYAFLRVLEYLIKHTEEHRNLQAICVFVSSFVAAVLTLFFFSFRRVPNLHVYLFFDLILGVAIGGVLFIVRTVIGMGDPKSTRTPWVYPGGRARANEGMHPAAQKPGGG
ncbi:MAG: hypothetical protein FJW34_04170 [Acidobacteria bacterium]|nr:hypothetical protein [Acidobacteriota bacterium]MBM4042975.1 hypothetical protein [Planctomycetota bacterium]